MLTSRQFYKGVIGSSAILFGVGASLNQFAQAVQLADGTFYFVQPPSLLRARTTDKGVRALGAKYYFTLSVPEGAGEPLQRVTIAQQEGADTIRFSLDKTQAFADDEGDKLALGKVTRDKATRTVSVVFNPPVPPGQTVTVRLRPFQNPSAPGVYLFGVTAFPQGEKAHGQFLGFGRLQFYSGSNGLSSIWLWR